MKFADVKPDLIERLRRVRGVVCDLDGTVVLGDKRNRGLNPLPGGREFVTWLNEHEMPFVLFTNGTTRTPQHYAGILRETGFDVTDENLMTPASSAVDVFVRKGFKRVMVLGGAGLTQPLQEAGIEALQPTRTEHVDAVLVGWYREFTMECLESACHAVWDGARLYSCSQSLFFASAEGKSLGTSRAISAMIKDLTGCRVTIIGKPSLDALRSAGRRLGVATRSLAVVGDDPSLEVPMAHRGKALAIAVSTGIGAAHEFARLPEAKQPHLALKDIDELLAICRQLC